MIGGVKLSDHQFSDYCTKTRWQQWWQNMKARGYDRVTDKAPFALGMGGEWWSNDLHCLVVPSGRDKNGHAVYVLCYRTQKGYELVFTAHSTVHDDLLMTACVLRDYLQGNTNQED